MGVISTLGVLSEHHIWQRVSASRNVGNAAEPILLRQNKQSMKAYSAKVNVGLSVKRLRVRVGLFVILCIQHAMLPPAGGDRISCRYHFSGPPVGLRWITGDHRWTVIGYQPGKKIFQCTIVFFPYKILARNAFN